MGGTSIEKIFFLSIHLPSYIISHSNAHKPIHFPKPTQELHTMSHVPTNSPKIPPKTTLPTPVAGLSNKETSSELIWSPRTPSVSTDLPPFHVVYQRPTRHFPSCVASGPGLMMYLLVWWLAIPSYQVFVPVAPDNCPFIETFTPRTSQLGVRLLLVNSPWLSHQAWAFTSFL